jgi:DNA-binding NtrC family response regulator
MPDTLLVIEDEPLLGSELREEFAEAGWDAVLAADLQAEGLLLVHNLEPLVVLSDMNLPDGNAKDLLEKARAKASPRGWIFLTAYGGVPESRRALKLGAFGPLVALNCAALPRELMEAELFGHEAGAFTGAKGRRRGLIEQASGGALFVDEVSEHEPEPQAKLLKAIEDGRVRRVGATGS